MKLTDKISCWHSALGYARGSLIARLMLRSIGSHCEIHSSVKYWCPSKVVIGNHCEIRQGAFLDARSQNEIGITIGDGCRVKDYVGLAAYGGTIQLGRRVLVGRCTTIFGHGGVAIGDHSMLGPGCMIVSSNHLAYMDILPFQDLGFTREFIEIGSNVWLGGNVSVLAGSKIGANSIIAAGTVVNNDLEGNWIYGGIPARKLKPIDTKKPADIVTHTKDWGLLS
jgi:acetyltransferase-like isoleucine patch superfamily enzyme